MERARRQGDRGRRIPGEPQALAEQPGAGLRHAGRARRLPVQHGDPGRALRLGETSPPWTNRRGRAWSTSSAASGTSPCSRCCSTPPGRPAGRASRRSPTCAATPGCPAGQAGPGGLTDGAATERQLTGRVDRTGGVVTDEDGCGSRDCFGLTGRMAQPEGLAGPAGEHGDRHDRYCCHSPGGTGRQTRTSQHAVCPAAPGQGAAPGLVTSCRSQRRCSSGRDDDACVTAGQTAIVRWILPLRMPLTGRTLNGLAFEFCV